MWTYIVDSCFHLGVTIVITGIDVITNIGLIGIIAGIGIITGIGVITGISVITGIGVIICISVVVVVIRIFLILLSQSRILTNIKHILYAQIQLRCPLKYKRYIENQHALYFI